MSLASILHSLKARLRPARPATRRSPARRRSHRLCLEALEDRFLPSGYLQTNLASDQPGVAMIHDPELVDGWGLALNETPTGTFWVSARGTGLSTVYVGDRPGVPFAKSTLTVTIPGGAPTGQVFSGSASDFIVSAGGKSGPSRFITVSDTGDLTGWNPTVPSPPVPARIAHLTTTTPGAVYTGLAIGNNGAGNFLYAADFKGGKIDVFDRTWARTALAGSFTDPTMRDDYAPFNIQRLGNQLFVTYAQKHDDRVPHGGNGFVSVFDMNGNFQSRLISEGGLQAPWGLALAPADWGEFSGALLVGNFHGGRIGAYDPNTGAFLGHLRNADGDRIRIDGLWGLAFGNGNTGDRKALYFTAGPDNQRHGLFGSLRVAAAASPRQTSRSDASAQQNVDGSLLAAVSSGAFGIAGMARIAPNETPYGNPSPASVDQDASSSIAHQNDPSSWLGSLSRSAEDGASLGALDDLFASEFRLEEGWLDQSGR